MKVSGSQYKVGTVVFIDGQRVDLLAWLQQQGPHAVDVLAEFGVKEHLAARLIAQPVPPDILQQRQAQLRDWERKKQKPASPQRRALLAWSIYMTNAPASLLATDELGPIIRTRWQIEKVFFLWKSEGQLDEWRTLKPWRILCEVYAKLIALLIQHWLMLVADIHDVRRSAIQASRTIRKQAWHLAFVLTDLTRLQCVITHIGQCLRAGCWISSSTTSPPTFQLFYPLT
jgi:Transposase DDE domain